MANDYKYRCVNCGESYDLKGVQYLCKSCSSSNYAGEALQGVLKVVYPYKAIEAKLLKNPKLLSETSYFDLLPLNSLESMPPLLVGNTPLYSYAKRTESLAYSLHLKVESSNPTFSFKDRASALVSAFAKEQGIDKIIAASTGNAGSSLAGICASQKQEAIIFVPENAPKAKLSQVLMYGAKLIPVKGNYDDAYDLSLKVSEKYGWYNRNTAYNPFTIEGKKTVSFELFEQMESVPDKIFVPVGDGVIIAGVFKGFEDLLLLGLIEKMPQIIAVQAEGSSSLIDNLNQEDPIFARASTIADSIAVDIPRNFYMAKEFMNTYDGIGIKVSDKEILQASKLLAKEYGLFVEPAAAAAYAGLEKHIDNGQLNDNEAVVILLTGNGLKDIGAVSQIIDFPEAIDPNHFDFEQL